MILILGGTTEGRLAVSVADEAGKPYFYSTKGTEQEVACKNGVRISGGLDARHMEDFCREHTIRLMVDAAHPFAEKLHHTIEEIAQKLQLPVIRFERRYPPRTQEVIWCEDYEDAMRRMEQDGVGSLLILTGVQTLARLKPYWSRHTSWARVLDREESVRLAEQTGFPIEGLLFYHPEEDERETFERYTPQAMLTKESGESGGFTEKVKAAKELGLSVYAVKRPVLPAYTSTVTGKHGLRKAIESLLPGFYDLHSGFTTGSCATAAAKSALWALLSGDEYEECSIQLPDGEVVTLPIERVTLQSDRATAIVIKDAGDDPDVTNGCEIGATVSFNHSSEIRFLQGEGVGKVTLPGIGLPVGDPAINPTPRQMIRHELSALYQGGLDVEIFVPKGRELALRTFNPKLGIVDGISIIGTSGVVRPFSSEAFVESIRREIEVCLAIGAPRLVLNSGAKSERFVKREYPDLPPQAFVHYGNFIGESLRVAGELRVKEVIMGIMLGKAVKLAEGSLDTHSKKTVMNKDFLKRLALEAGCGENTIQAMEEMTLARELWKILPEEEQRCFFPLLLSRCLKHLVSFLPGGQLSILLIDEEGHIPYRIS